MKSLIAAAPTTAGGALLAQAPPAGPWTLDDQTGAGRTRLRVGETGGMSRGRARQRIRVE